MDNINGICQWFAVQVKPRFEKNSALLLREKGFDEFLPLYRCRRQWQHRNATIQLPLFPGYLFCRFDPRDRLPILTTAGVRGIVSVAKVPEPIHEREIEDIRTLIKAGTTVQPFPFTGGQTVQIASGPLAGVTGTIVTVKKSRRVVVSISLLQRSVAADIEPDCVSLAVDV
jgi:transcription antitermination factor NusG